MYKLETPRHRVYAFGIDYKITPENDIALIEVNGINSGIKGYARLHPEAEWTRNAIWKLLNDYLSLHDNLDDFEPSEEEIKNNKDKWIKDNKSKFHIPGEYNQIELGTKDKALSKILIPDLKQAPFMYWNANNFDDLQSFLEDCYNSENKLIDIEQYPFLVFKPRFGTCQGQGIRIFQIRKRKEIPHGMREHIKDKYDYLIEAFVPSKLFNNPETGYGHDGCGRCLMDWYVDLEMRRMKPIYHANYVRLSPNPWNEEKKSEFMMKANLCGEIPAIPVDAPDEFDMDIKLISTEVAKAMIGYGLYYLDRKKIRGL